MILPMIYHLTQNQKMKTNKIIYFRKPVQDDKSIQEQREEMLSQQEEILAQREQIFELSNYWNGEIDD